MGIPTQNSARTAQLWGSSCLLVVSALFCQVLNGCFLTHATLYTTKQDAKPHFAPQGGARGSTVQLVTERLKQHITKVPHLTAFRRCPLGPRVVMNSTLLKH